MRKLLVAAAAGASVLGGAMIAQTVQAQPYYAPAPAYVAPAYHYDRWGRLVYDAPRAYVPPVVEGALIGPALADAYGEVPFDRYGPDPNGMIARDGHRIKCKLTDEYSYRMGRGAEGSFEWTKLVPSSHLAWSGPAVKAGLGSMQPAGWWDLSDSGGGTRVQLVMAPQPGGLLKLLAPFMAAAMRKENNQALERLKQRLEG